MTHTLSIIDLSHHNPTPDFVAAEAAGLVGVIHKATEGTDFTDDEYWRRRQPAEDAGLLWGAYHFLKHGNARDQIDFFLNKTMPLKGSRAVIDYEHDDCTLDDLHEAVETLAKGAPSLQIAVYGGHLLKQQLGDHSDDLLATTALWIAQYTSDASPTWPQNTWPVWSLWQYSDGSSGGEPRSMPGFSPPFDCNVFNGSLDQCRAWMGPAGQEPSPPVEVPFVDIEISTNPGTAVTVRINGELLQVVA